MSKFKLAIGLHNHQPVGNFDFVFEDSHQKAYKPFLELLLKHPTIRLSLHQSGILWNWQKKHHPYYLEQVKTLVKQKQIELMTGGFYEPILISIPENDALGQIAMLDSFIKDNFNVTTNGAWLTERIWEPHLPKVLNDAGVKFIPVDDTHFIYAGFESTQLTGPYVTEFDGYPLTLLPISKAMRYLIPFGTVKDIITELKKMAEENPEGMVIYADDGEKFGSWPNTYKHCYEDGWMEEFFTALEQNSEWLEVIPLSEAAAELPVGRAYLPSASYAEMLHWSLPPKAFLEYENFEHYLADENLDEQYSRFVRGGHWRGFLTKYDEVNFMHKKMLYLSKQLEFIDKNHPLYAGCEDALFASQCNCPYWHGVFGGLYLPHIRAAIYENLIKAESLIAKMNNRTKSLTVVDYDNDGHAEILLATDKLSAIFKPNNGGMLVDLSLLDKQFSVTDTLTRRKEGYHLKLDKAVTQDNADSTKSIHDLVLTKEEGLKDILIEDWYLKRCFIDHIFTNDVEFDDFVSNEFGEYGDFVLEKYESELVDETTVKLFRNGNLWRPDGVIPCKIEKVFRFYPDSKEIDIMYKLSAESDENVDINFAVENNFNFQAGHAEDRYIAVDTVRHDEAYLDSTAAYQSANSVSLIDEYRQIALHLATDKKSDLWHCPIFTVSLSEGGFEKVYQGTTVVNRFRLSVGRKPVELLFKLTALTDKELTKIPKTDNSHAI
ncbi:MAG: DUF1926 domain-containing protein [Calditrichaeota bacterium]|nr:MAG: DUF1926 domain-containing protein [Calditrichota bacterium]